MVVVSKMLYAHHYFVRRSRCGTCTGPRAWWVLADTVNSSRTDGLTGFTGLFVRPKVRSEARAGTISMLTNTKQKLEVARPAIGSVVSDDEGVVERFGQGAGVDTLHAEGAGREDAGGQEFLIGQRRGD